MLYIDIHNFLELTYSLEECIYVSLLLEEKYVDSELFKERYNLIISNDLIEEIKTYLAPSLNKWEEFISLYPKKTPDGRMLHERINMCKQLYKDKVKTKAKHKLIIGCLEKEIKQRRMTDNLNFMKHTYHYLQYEGWLTYQDDTDKPESHTVEINLF